MKIASATSGTTLNATTFALQESQKEKRESKNPGKYSEEIILENFPNTGKEIATQSRNCRESHTG